MSQTVPMIGLITGPITREPPMSPVLSRAVCLALAMSLAQIIWIATLALIA